MELIIYDKSGVQISSTREFNYSAEAMGEKNINLTINSPEKIDFTPFCYVTFKGENFYLQSESPSKRTSASGYKGDALQYNLTFKSKQTDLVNCDFLDHLLGAETYYSGMGDFSFFGDVYDLGRRIQANLNMEGNGWVVKMPKAGYTDPQSVSGIGVSQRTLNSETKQITVSDENCWNALTRAFSDFGFNFYLDTTNKIIYIGVTYPELRVSDDPVVFEYGSKKGLYEINREINADGLITRLRAYGSEKNIPSGYMSSGKRVVSRLQLPSYRTTQSTSSPVDYILASQAIIDYYGIRPGKKNFDEIYPTIENITDSNGHRIDSIYAVEEIIDTIDENGDYVQPSFWISLYDMGFDINQLPVSEEATITMKSGLCGGIDFKIVEAKAVAEPGEGEDDPYGYVNGVRWRYKLEKNSSYSSNYVLPSGSNLIAAGDTFSLINISIPDTYVISAEQKLLEAAQAYLLKNCKSKISYTVNLDEIYMANNPLVEQILREGRNVKIIDNDLGDTTDDNGVSYYTIKSIQSLTIRYQTDKILPTYTITLAEGLIAGLINRIQNEIEGTKENVNLTVIQNSQDRRNAVRNTRNLRALKNYTYDPDGYFDTTRLKPLSIETLYLAVGGKSGNFSTNGVKTKTYNDGGYKVNITAGFVNHREIWWTPVPEEGQDPLDPLLRPDSGSERYSWAINSNTTFTMTDDTKPYYVFARCSQIEGIGDWLVTTEQKAYKDSTYYYFEFGSIELPSEGRRDLVPTKGAFFVSGGQIYGDNLQSINYTEDNTNQGSKYGLNDGTIRLGNNTKGLAYTLDDGVKLYGPLVVGPDGGSFPIGRPRGAYIPGTPYYKGDEVTYSGSTWMYINNVPSDEAVAPAPEEGVYWHLTAAKGDTGNTGAPGLNGADGEDGAAGADSRYCTLAAAAMAVNFDTAGNTPSPSSILLTAVAYNLVGTAYYQFFENDSSLGSPSTTNTKTLSLTGRVYIDMPRKIEVQVREGSSIGPIVARDQISIIGMKAGQNAVQGIIENSSHTVPSSSTGVVSSYAGSGTKIQVYEGATLLTFNTVLAAGRFAVGTPVVSPAGKITVGARSGSGTTICTVADHSAMDNSTDLVTITYPITARKADGTDVTFNLVQTITKSKQGTTGDPGTPAPYYEYRYAVNGSTVVYPAITVTDRNPVNYSMAKPAVETMQTLWYTIAKVSADGSTLLENWTTPEKMAVNNNGSYNPTPVDRETYSGTSSYHGGTDYIDIVYSAGRFYYARIDAGNIPTGTAPTNTAYWNPFEAKVPNIATGLLLADLAYIRNLGVRYVKTAESGKRIFIDGDNNTMILFDSDGNETARIDDDIDSDQAGTPLGGLKARNPITGKVTYVTANGVFNNGSGVSFLSATLGITTNANLVGLLQTRNSDANGYSAAVVGVDQTTSGNSKSYAGFFLGKVRGSTVVESFMKTPSDRGLYDLPDSDATLSSTYSSDKKYFFWGGAKTAGRVYNLPDPADYEGGEIIWFANGNDYRSELKARYGDTINGYAYNARWFTLNGPTDFVEFMSNGSNMWRIVRSGGDNVVF
ncbi:MAG: hypothetical protein ABFC84_13395 [Veillonellales bacterium]